jgi:hypothetical protein
MWQRGKLDLFLMDAGFYEWAESGEISSNEKQSPSK